MTILSWTQYFAEITKTVAKRSSCCRRQVGAILVKDKRIIATGYNGTPSGMKNCNDGGCPRCNSAEKSDPSTLLECLCVHAEENVIIQSALAGVSPEGSTIYVTDSPCLHCFKLLLSAKVSEVYYLKKYDDKALEIFSKYFKKVGSFAEKIVEEALDK